MKSLLLVFCLTCFLQPCVRAQVDSTGYVDSTDLARVFKGKKASAKAGKSGAPEQGKLILFAVPIFGSNPTLGAFYGFGATGAIYLGEPDNTSISNLSSSVQFTTKDQFVASLKGTIMTPANGWELLVDLRYSFFSENTFGLGSDYRQPIKESWNLGGTQTTGISGAQSLTFNAVRVHFTALRELIDNVYAGVGYNLDYHWKIIDASLNLDGPEPVVTSHYAYSMMNGFDPERYTTSGTTLNVVYDSRDHTLNAYRGAFLQLAYVVNAEFLGSDQKSQKLYMEARVFKPISETRPRHLIGFWGIGAIQVSDDLPYLDLPAAASDMRNRIGRGYVAGRFRGPAWVTAETEYRVPITSNGLFGAVLFGSITTASREAIVIGSESVPSLRLFEAIRPAGGFGARVMLDRSGRLNLALDMAFGQKGAKGFYFAVGETF